MVVMLVVERLSNMAEERKVISSAVMLIVFFAEHFLFFFKRSINGNFEFLCLLLRTCGHDGLHDVEILLVDVQSLQVQSRGHLFVLLRKTSVNFDERVKSCLKSAQELTGQGLHVDDMGLVVSLARGLQRLLHLEDVDSLPVHY